MQPDVNDTGFPELSEIRQVYDPRTEASLDRNTLTSIVRTEVKFLVPDNYSPEIIL